MRVSLLMVLLMVVQVTCAYALSLSLQEKQDVVSLANRVQDIPKPTSIEFQACVKTVNLTPGKVQTRIVHYPELLNPIFLVGDDVRSHAWLNYNAAMLKTHHAVGFLVNENCQGKENLIKHRDGMKLLPLNGTAFVRRFHIKHVPVLISQHFIEQ